MTHLPSLSGLRAFDAAGRTLNLRAAAEELGVTQGAVAQQVRGLEAQLGVSLFERHSKGYSLQRRDAVTTRRSNRLSVYCAKLLTRCARKTQKCLSV
ncbi:LysR family transcriptional regulator [Ruegeria atlantica]|uniref:LysR family transcriptional regulator n=1 Tax=Ruegeria atlantica TaxID=81569 RepID=UPI0034A020FC